MELFVRHGAMLSAVLQRILAVSNYRKDNARLSATMSAQILPEM